MKTKTASYIPEETVLETPRIKTVDLQVGVADHNLEAKIIAAFALAKSAGWELDLTLAAGYPMQNNIKQF